MTEFKAGDKVKLVNINDLDEFDIDRFESDSVYIVDRVGPTLIYTTKYPSSGYCRWRFEKVEEIYTEYVIFNDGEIYKFSSYGELLQFVNSQNIVRHNLPVYKLDKVLFPRTVTITEWS